MFGVNMQKLVSIITPTYNHENYIEDCIESVIAQNYQQWELIIIDDGSTDNTRRIVKKFLNDRRISYIRQNNTGIWNLKLTYNKALEIAKGDYLAILEGDDKWPKNKLSVQMKSFDNPEVVLSWGKVGVINDQNQLVEIAPNYEKVNQVSDPLKELLFNNFIPACTVIVKKDVIKKIGGFKQPDKSPCVDYATWLELSLNGRFEYIPEVLGFWRRHESQASLLNALDMINAHNKYSIEFFDRLPEKNKESLKITSEEISLNKNKKEVEAYFYIGRMSLLNRKWDQSRIYFYKSFLKGSFKYKIASLISIFFSIVKKDIEFLF